MSRTNHKTKGAGYEYWKSRCPKADWLAKPGRETKKLTIRILRRKNKQDIKREER